MAVSLSADLTEIDDCDSATNWSSNEAFAADTTSFREGTASIGIEKVSQETSYARYDYYTDHGSVYLNITGETHIYFWVQTTSTPDTIDNGGIRLRLTDASGNYKEWWVGGSDNYTGGFQCYVVYTGLTPDDSSGTLNLAQIRYVTVYFKILTKYLVNAPNCWVDILYYGSGLVVEGGTSGDPGTFDEIIAADVTPAYGVLNKYQGVFFAQGPITFGDSDGTSDTYFQDYSQLLIFKDALVSNDHYKINVVGNSTGTNSFKLGSKSGTAGIQGCTIKSAGDIKVSIDATDTDVNVLGLYGCTFIDIGESEFSPGATNKEVLSCNFNDSARVVANSMDMANCTIVNADNFGMEANVADFSVVDSNFISCPDAILHTLSGVYQYDNLKFTNNTYDIAFSGASSSDTLVIESINNSNPGNYRIIVGSGVSIINAVYLTVDVENIYGAPINSAAVAIYTASGTVLELLNELTVAGRAQDTYNYTGDMPVTVRIRKSSSGSTRYFPIDTTGTITEGGYTLTAVMYEDNIAS